MFQKKMRRHFWHCLLPVSECWHAVCYYCFLFLLSHLIGVDRKAVYDAKNVTATLLRVLHYTYEKTDPDANQQHRSLELLFNTLSECRPTEEDRGKFSALGLKGSMLKTAIESQTTRDTISKVLTVFTGKC
jgi:hypothetical protein